MQDLLSAARMLVALQELRKGWLDQKTTDKGKAFGDKHGLGNGMSAAQATHGVDAYHHQSSCEDPSCRGCLSTAAKTHGAEQGLSHHKDCDDLGCSGACRSQAFVYTDPMNNDQEPTHDYTGFLPAYKGKLGNARLFVRHQFVQHKTNGKQLNKIRAEVWVPHGQGGSGGTRIDPRDNSHWQQVVSSEIGFWPRYAGGGDEWVMGHGIHAQARVLNGKDREFIKSASKAAIHAYRQRKDVPNNFVDLGGYSRMHPDQLEYVERLPNFHGTSPDRSRLR